MYPSGQPPGPPGPGPVGPPGSGAIGSGSLGVPPSLGLGSTIGATGLGSTLGGSTGGPLIGGQTTLPLPSTLGVTGPWDGSQTGMCYSLNLKLSFI